MDAQPGTITLERPDDHTLTLTAIPWADDPGRVRTTEAVNANADELVARLDRRGLLLLERGVERVEGGRAIRATMRFDGVVPPLYPPTSADPRRRHEPGRDERRQPPPGARRVKPL